MTFSRDYQKSRVQKLADFWVLGYMLGKYQGKPLKPDHVLAFCQASFLMILSQVRFLTLAPGVALFIIARTWRQPRCPSADEWRRKLWYIYTMEYYSAIKKNTFE